MTTPTNPPLPSLSTRATANRLTRICLWAAGRMGARTDRRGSDRPGLPLHLGERIDHGW